MKDDYEWLDLMPTGWVDLAREMIDKIKKVNHIFTIYDMKEKWGHIDMYGYPYTPEVDEIISEYSYKSSRTCFQCGKPATKYSTGYILPFCEECAKESPQHRYKEIMR